MATLADYAKLMVPRRRAAWSIGIYRGTSPFDLAPHPGVAAQPVLSPSSLGAIRADGVADPFMLRSGGEWQMFFEIENRVSGRGEIGLAVSRDALSWRFEGVVLKEPFHLSYPHVFEFDGAHYMLPESGAHGVLRLYKAESYPMRWKVHAELLHGDLADATPFRHAGRWWIVALEGFRVRDAMVIHSADRLEGPWRPHPANPISQHNSRTARPAGRVIAHAGRLIRFAQDCEVHYGRLVHAFAIEELSERRYVESPVGERDVLAPSGAGWNASGMHHVDLHEIGPSDWIACVDGRRTALRWPVADRTLARLRRTGGSR